MQRFYSGYANLNYDNNRKFVQIFHAIITKGIGRFLNQIVAFFICNAFAGNFPLSRLFPMIGLDLLNIHLIVYIVASSFCIYQELGLTH